MEGLLGKAEKEGVTVINTGGYKAVDKNRGGMGGEGGAEAIDIAEMEVGRAGGVVNVGFEGE